MADFYTEMAATAEELIKEFGRTVSVRKVTTGAPADVAKPWVPGAEKTADTVTKGVFLETNRSFITGEVIPEDKSLVLLSAKNLGNIVPIGKDRLVDGSKVWEIDTVETLKPADITLLYELMV